jgi:hypothetical protein
VGTGVLLQVGLGQPATERQARGGPPRKGQGDDEQGEVAQDLGRVGGLPRGDLTPVAEATAVDLQPARPRRTDPDEEHDQQDGGSDRRRPDEDPEQQGEAHRDLENGQPEGHRGDERLGQQPVGPDGADGGRRIGHLQQAGDEEHPAEHEPAAGREPRSARLAPHVSECSAPNPGNP